MQTASITQRIALEGEDDIKNALKDLGQVGEKAFQQVEEATGISNSHLLAFSNVIFGLREHIENTHRAFEPVIEQFGELREGANKFGEALTNVGERIFPNFKEVVALGTAAGVAGLAEFIVSGARAAKEVGDMSRALGINVTQFQAMKGAAAAAGIEGEKFTNMLSRFAQHATEAANSQLQDFGSLAKMLSGDISTMGTQVLRGTQQVADGAASIIIRGNQKLGASAGQALTQIDGRVALSIQKGTQLGAKLEEQGRILFALYAQAGVPIHKTAHQLAIDLENVAARGDAAGKAARDLIDKLGGGGLVPAQNAFEAIDRYTANWQQNLSRIVTMWKADGDKLVPKNLEEAFLEVSDRVKGMDAAMQNAFVRQNFGRDATRLIEVLRKGSAGIRDMGEEFTKLGIAIKPEETILGGELMEKLEHFETAVENLRTAFAVGLSPAMVPVLHDLTIAIGQNYEGVRKWAEEISNRAAPGLKELAEWIGHGSEHLEIHEEWVKGVIAAWNGAVQAVKFLVGGFNAVVAAADGVAAAVNAIFGTHFTGLSIVAILAVGKITGAFTLLSATVGLFLDSLGLVARGFTFAVKVAADLGLIRVGVGGLRVAFDGLKTFLVEFFGLRSIGALFAPMLAAIGPAGWIILALAGIVAALYAWKGSWEEVFKFLQEGWDNLKGTVSAFIELVKSAVEAFGRFLSKGQDVQAQATEQGGAQMASGGAVIGRGGIDNVPIWATAGEFMMRTAAVAKYGLGFMHAINSLSVPRLAYAGGGPIIAPPQFPHFAEGGVVPSVKDSLEGYGRYFTLSIEGNEWKNLFAPEDTANSMINFARSKEIIRTGRMPEWKSK